jgi:hypothetical protein
MKIITQKRSINKNELEIKTLIVYETTDSDEIKIKEIEFEEEDDGYSLPYEILAIIRASYELPSKYDILAFLKDEFGTLKIIGKRALLGRFIIDKDKLEEFEETLREYFKNGFERLEQIEERGYHGDTIFKIDRYPDDDKLAKLNEEIRDPRT